MSNSTRQSLLLLSHYYRICMYICTRLFACVLVVLLNETYGYFCVNYSSLKTRLYNTFFSSCVTGGIQKTFYSRRRGGTVDPAHVSPASVETYRPCSHGIYLEERPILRDPHESLQLGPGEEASVPACNRCPGKD